MRKNRNYFRHDENKELFSKTKQKLVMPVSQKLVMPVSQKFVMSASQTLAIRRVFGRCTFVKNLLTKEQVK